MIPIERGDPVSRRSDGKAGVALRPSITSHSGSGWIVLWPEEGKSYEPEENLERQPQESDWSER